MGDDQLGATPVLLRSLLGVLGELAEPEQVLRTILDQAVKQTGAERGVFVEVDAKGALEFRVLHRFDPGDLQGEGGGFSRSVCAEVLKRGEGLLLHDALRAPGIGTAESVKAMRLVSVLCEPIRSEGRILALVHLEHGRPRQFTDAHRELLRALAGIAGPVLDALRAGREVLAERDALRVRESRARIELEENREALARGWSFGRFVGRSPAVRDLEAALRRAAATDYPVLLLGETGTGKGILARVLHHLGARREQAFVTVFCPSLEKGLVEAELFGARRGAFTGADTDRPGKVQVAEGGTLFFDEIGELPLELQPKILRLLQERTYERLGEAAERRADVRIVAATHRDLEADVVAGRFRRDLFERLNFLPLTVPPLRERREDVPLLLRHFLDQDERGRWVTLDADAERFLVELDFLWPGNVRHLEQLAVRLAVQGGEGPVGRGEIAHRMGFDRAKPGAPAAPRSGDDALPDIGLPALLEQAEREWLQRALRAYPDLTRRDLAARLKISEPTLYKKLKEHGL